MKSDHIKKNAIIEDLFLQMIWKIYTSDIFCSCIRSSDKSLMNVFLSDWHSMMVLTFSSITNVH